MFVLGGFEGKIKTKTKKIIFRSVAHRTNNFSTLFIRRFYKPPDMDRISGLVNAPHFLKAPLVVKTKP